MWDISYEWGEIGGNGEIWGDFSMEKWGKYVWKWGDFGIFLPPTQSEGIKD